MHYNPEREAVGGKGPRRSNDDVPNNRLSDTCDERLGPPPHPDAGAVRIT